MEILNAIGDSIYRNIIAGNVYLLILSGLKTTVFITLTGLFGGTVLAAALESVDPGRVRAARTLGFTKWGAFYYIVLPQAGEFARPVYQNAVINLIQWTSVVGYITISDLTRVINNIGARTADPFAVIFLGILIYLALAYATYLVFALAAI